MKEIYVTWISMNDEFISEFLYLYSPNYIDICNLLHELHHERDDDRYNYKQIIAWSENDNKNKV